MLVPGSPAQNKIVVRLDHRDRMRRIHGNAGALGIVIPLVLAPFEHIAMHIVKAPFVRGFFTDLMKSSATVLSMPKVLNTEIGICSRARSIFPFGLSRQTVLVALGNSAGFQFLFRHFSAELGGIFPTRSI